MACRKPPIPHSRDGMPTGAVPSAASDAAGEAESSPTARLRERLRSLSQVRCDTIGVVSLARRAQFMAEQLQSVFGMDGCVIRLLDGDDLVLLASAGLPDGSCPPRIPGDCGIASEILKRNSPLFIPDLRADPALASEQSRPPDPRAFVSYAGAPMLAGTRVLGLLGLYSRTRREDVTQADLDCVQLMANQISLALANDNLYEQVAREHRRLEAEVATRSQAEKLLAESEQRFRLATEAVSGIVYECDWSAQTFICSEGLASVLGHNPVDTPLTIAWWRDQLHPEDRARVVQQLHEAFAQRVSVRSCEYRVRQRGGRYIWVEDRHRILYTSEGTPARLIGCTVSIDARKAAEQLLKESEQRLRLAAGAARMFAFEWDPRTDQTERSAECADILGQDTHRDTGQAYLGRIHPDDRAHFTRILAELAPERPGYRVSYRLIRPDGQTVWLEEAAHGFFGGDGMLVRLVGMTADVTERKLAEEEMRQLRDEVATVFRISAMGELTATIAHELNQPLAAIITNAQACQRLLDRLDPDLAEVRSALAEMITDGSRAHAVVARVRDFLRRGEAERTRVDLNAIVQSVVPLVHSRLVRDRIVFTCDLDAGLPRVTGGFGELQQVVLNLIMNAADAVAPRPAASRRLHVASHRRPDGTVSVAVEDSGIGVPEKDRERLFDPFFTTKPNGTGMGLPICRSIIEAHGGRLWVESDGRTGAVFQFAIPAAGGL